MQEMRAILVGVLLDSTTKSTARNVSIEWHAPFFSGGGYCSEASTVVVALEDAGMDTYAVQHGDSYSESYARGQRGSATFARVAALASKRRRRRVDVVVCHSEPGAWHVSDGPSWPSSPCPPARAGLVVGRTMFETDRIPEGWTRRLNAVDEVWVPTEFQRDIFAAGGVERLQVVGEAVDGEAFRPEGPRWKGVEDAAFVALSVFKWEHRKGWDLLVAAWARVCRPSDVLILVSNAYHSDADFEAKLEAFVRDRLGDDRGLEALCRLVVLTDLPHDELAAVYRRADVLLAPTRGEGWGRPHVEAMASATPIIATNWSGPTAYLTESNGYPLRFRPSLVPVGQGPFRDHKWAEPDVDHLVHLIQRARDDPVERAAKGRRARADIVQRYAPAALARDIRARLDNLLDQRRRDHEL